MKLNTAKSICNSQLPLYRFANQVKIFERYQILTVKINLPEQIEAYLCFDKAGPVSVHMYRTNQTPHAHSRAIKLNKNQFINLGNFDCFIKTDPFETTLTKVIAHIDDCINHEHYNNICHHKTSDHC